jgi:hypothetical protein
MSRKRHFLLLVGVTAGLAVLAVGAWLFWPRPSSITEENDDKVRVGMTREEVEAILGGPAGNHGFQERIVQTRDDIDVWRLAECGYLQWINSRYMVGVQLDFDNRVVGKDPGAATPAPLWRQALVSLRP